MSSEEDPVADFLARERSDLAGLEDEDNFGATEDISPQQNGTGDGDGGFPPMLNGFGGMNENGINPDANDYFPEDNNPPANIPNLPRQAAAPTPPPQVPRIEPEKIRKWREEQRTRLEKKDAQEEKEKQKWRDQAKRELEDWYKNRVEQVEKQKKTNKVTEQEFIRERDAVRPGQEWERITRLCEFNPKSSKNTKDVSRMRSLLLQLKTQPLNRNREQ